MISLKEEQQKIDIATNVLDDILRNDKLNPIITKLNQEAQKRSSLKRFLLLLADMSGLPLNVILTAKETHILDKLLYSNFSSNTTFYTHKYSSFNPNAFTIPGNIIPSFPKSSVAFQPFFNILNITNFLLKSIKITQTLIRVWM